MTTQTNDSNSQTCLTNCELTKAGAQLSTIYMRDREGLCARSSLDLEDNRVLTIRTRKNSLNKRLETTASVGTLDRGFISTRLGFNGEGDYRGLFLTSQPARITVRLVQTQHEQGIRQLDQILQAVHLHYSRQATTAQAALEQSHG